MIMRPVLFALSALLMTALSAPAQNVSAPTQEKSVNPGINNSYLVDDIDVSQWVERFEREGREVYDNRQKLIGVCELKPGMAVADIGSGTGLFTELLAREVGKDGSAYAVDIVPAFLAKVRSRMAEKGIENVTTVHCSDRDVKLPENSIDVAYICDVYHHFEYPMSSMTSLHKALKPGGRIVLVEFEREEGRSSDWIMSHVRAGKDVFSKEITDAGFTLETEVTGILKENYIRVFKSTKPAKTSGTSASSDRTSASE